MVSLSEKLAKKSAHVGVVGLGYVGLPLALEMARAGYRVTGIEINEDKVAAVNRGSSYVEDVKDGDLAPLVASGNLRATTDYGVVGQLDALSICVPTPLRKTKDPDVSFIRNAARTIGEHLTGTTLVVLESTTYPGTTEELVVPLLTGGGRRLGEDVYVAFSPERIDPGNREFNTSNTPKVIGGVTPACAEMATLFYNDVVGSVHDVGSARAAEMVKLLENTFRAVNIALVNEMLLMCDRMDIDIWRVVDAAATKPFGFMPFYPGPGIGGHCIPIDPMYLSWKAKTYDFFNRFIELATDINGNMPRFAVQKLMRVLNEHALALNGAQILVVGVAYKGGVSDTRESPGLEILRLLRQHHAKIGYHDPHVAELIVDDQTHHSLPLTPDVLSRQSCVLIATAHAEIDWRVVVEHAPLVFDTRNALKDNPAPHVFQL